MSIYHGCIIEDVVATDALRNFRQHLQDLEQEIATEVATLAASMATLEGTAGKASATIGTAPNDQVFWEAADVGSAGNRIAVTYLYLGPDVVGGVLVARAASSYVVGDFIYCVLPVDVAGAVSQDVATCLLIWLANSDVTDLVTGTLVGTGANLPTAQPTTFLSGGSDVPLTDAEDVANTIAKSFQQPTYQELMRSVDIPIVSTDAEIRQYLQEDDQYVLLSTGKLLLVDDSDNLTGINKIYDIVGSVTTTKTILSGMVQKRPTLLTTQNVTTATTQMICGALQTITSVTETYRDLDTNVYTSSNLWAGGDLSQLNHYCFWAEAVDATRHNYEKLRGWGFPDSYIGDILTGDAPDPDEIATSELQPDIPDVLTVVDPDLLDYLGLTDAEIAELLAADVDGVSVPKQLSMDARVAAAAGLLRRKPLVRDDGTRSSVQSGIVAPQVTNFANLTADGDLAKELAARGSACARQIKNFASLPEAASMDLPNLDFGKMTAQAKKVESAYGALSSAVDSALKTFDRGFGGLLDSVKSILNKIQNVSSLSENVLNNELGECLLGAGTAATGKPNYTGFSGPGGSSIPSLSSITGGLPIPKAQLASALSSLSTSLDASITDQFGTVMKSLEKPMCIANQLLNGIQGFDLDGLTNPCNSGKDTDDSCPAEDVQAVIDASGALTATLGTIPSLDNAATTEAVLNVTEEIQQFTGLAKKTATSTTQTVTRGVSAVLSDLQKTVDAKLKIVDEFDKSIKQLFGGIRDFKASAADVTSAASGCSPPQLGDLTDAIFDYI